MLDSISRRRFLRASAAGAGSLAAPGRGAFDLLADPLKMPIGLQLYTVGPDLAKKKIKIEHYFVEQEPPFSEMPPLQAIKVSYDCLHSLNV